MKKWSVLFFVVSLLVLFSGCSGDRTAEDLARETFQAFVDDNARAYKQLYVRQSDLESIIANSSIPDDMKNNARKELRAKTAFWRTFSKAQFNHMRFRAYDRGVNWQDTEILEINTEPSSYGYFGFERAFNEKYGIEVLDIEVTFLSSQDTFIMHLDDCINTKTRGWLLTEEVRIHKKNFY